MNKFIPNSFQVPNAFIDEMLEKISGNACKIYLLIVRKTRGWNKESDRISYSQIQKSTGISHRATICKALDELLENGLIFVQKGNEKLSNEYRLNDDFAGSKNGLDKNCTSSKNEPTGSKNEQEAGSKNEHTEIHIFKNTYTEIQEYEHTHENSQNSIEPKSKKTTKQKKSVGIEKPTELDEQIWNDFLKTKKQRTKSDLTLTAWNRFYKQVLTACEQTNHTVNQVFEFWITDVKWCGFNADWYLNRLQTTQQNNQAKPSVMDELREMAKHAPQNEYFNDLPTFENSQNLIGVEYE